MIEILERKHAILAAEFDRYVVEHPEFAAEIPRNAQIILDKRWPHAKAQRRKGFFYREILNPSYRANRMLPIDHGDLCAAHENALSLDPLP